MFDHFKFIAPFYDRLMGPPDPLRLNRTAVKLIALAERTTLMRSRFFRPQEIRDMLAGRGLKVQIQADRRLTAWIIADKT